MDFRKKLKARLYTAIILIATGIIFICVNNIFNFKNDFLSPFGLGLITVGLVRIRNYFIITKTDESIKKQEIAEKDERNIAIANKAKSVSFIIFIFAASIAIITFAALNIYKDAVTILSLVVSFLVLIYWVAYWIIRKRG